LIIPNTKEPFEQHATAVDLVIDTGGGETLKRSMDVVKKEGKLFSIVEEPSKEKGIQVVKPDITPCPPWKNSKSFHRKLHN
jgi:NADPH:quinone reductase-like Zn-dependent oxidoreductase